MNHTFYEFLLVEESVGQPRSVKLRIFQAMLIGNILFEDPDSEHRQRCVKQIVHRYEHWIEDGLKWLSHQIHLFKIKRLSTYLSTESTEERKPEMAKRECKILVEKVPKELAHPKVAPASVNEEQPLKVSELSYGVVTR